jgi:hypothetical protein
MGMVISGKFTKGLYDDGERKDDRNPRADWGIGHDFTRILTGVWHNNGKRKDDGI